ncbi:MAG: hypothetical protein WBC83_01930, partial [Minisyncoccia bacterium]
MIFSFIPHTAHALDPVVAGFSVNGEAINPKCIQLMQPWISDNNFSVRQIVLEECQNSNLASEGISNIAREENVISFYDDPKDAHSYFGYEVLGVTDTGLFVVSHSGDIAIYRIESQKIFTDVLNHKSKQQHTITYIGSSWTPCLQGGE